jgi:nicotinamidase-related amidase
VALDLLLAIDVQRGFITPDTAHVPAAVEALQGRFARLVATRFFNPEGSLHRRLMGWNRFGRDSADFPLAFAPRPDARLLDKATYTAAAPSFLDDLRRNGIATVHLCGIATDNCVLKTAVDLFEAGIVPLVVADACGSHGGPDCHAAGLMLLRRFIGAGQIVYTSDLSR